MADRAPFPVTPAAAGGLLWVSTVVTFLGQIVAHLGTTHPYSLAHNYVSDLGVTSCGTLQLADYQAEVCSPWHLAMNFAFVAGGVAIIAGAILIYRAWPRRKTTIAGFALLACTGTGQIIAGLAPADLAPGAHILGAVLAIPTCNFAIALLGFAVWHSNRAIGVASLLLAIVGVTGLILTGIEDGAGLGLGTAQRIAAYPLTVWLIFIGDYVFLASRRQGSSA